MKSIKGIKKNNRCKWIYPNLNSAIRSVLHFKEVLFHPLIVFLPYCKIVQKYQRLVKKTTVTLKQIYQFLNILN